MRMKAEGERRTKVTPGRGTAHYLYLKLLQDGCHGELVVNRWMANSSGIAVGWRTQAALQLDGELERHGRCRAA